MCSTVCRVCLVDNGKMFFTLNHQFLEMYEKLSSAKLTTAEKPQGVCYICSSQLLRFCRFSEMAHRSDLILTDMLNKGIEVTRETILMAVLGKKDNVIDLSLAPMQFVTVNDCKSFETAAVTIKEEPLVVKHENTSFEDERFTGEITMHEDTIMGDSHNKRRSPFKDNTDHDINLHQCDKSREFIISKQNVASLSQTHYDYKANVRNASHENNKLEQVQCNSKSQLIMHMHTHTGEKPFKCMECDRDFSLKGNLKRHIMVTHTEERPYKCKECDKGFALNRYLKLHMLKHTGEKPYACNKCDKGFRCKSQLKEHVRRKHTE